MLTSFKLRIAVSILIIFEIQIDTQIDKKNSIFDNFLKLKQKMADIFFVKMTDI